MLLQQWFDRDIASESLRVPLCHTLNHAVPSPRWWAAQGSADSSHHFASSTWRILYLRKVCPQSFPRRNSACRCLVVLALTGNHLGRPWFRYSVEEIFRKAVIGRKRTKNTRCSFHCNCLILGEVARPERFELPAFWFVARCSNWLPGHPRVFIHSRYRTSPRQK